MAKTTSEEIKRKKEYVRFLKQQIYKLSSKHKWAVKQAEQLAQQIKDYEKEKKKTEKWLEGKG